MKSLLCVATLCVLALPVGIAAQTRGGSANTPPDASPGTGGGGQGGGSGPGGSSVGSNGTASPAFPQFGTWLDDASLEGRGTGRVTIGAGYWRMADGHQIDVPMIHAGYDLSDRIHVSAFVPFYRARYGTELTTGLDDMYLSAKVVLVNPAGEGRFGLAVSPALEILNSDFTTGERVHWALPVSAEVRATPRIRLYTAGGYFSRGAAFGGMAVEWTAPTASVVWVSLTDSYALEAGTDTTPPTGDRHLTNLAVGLTQFINERLAAYVNVGRTMWDDNSGRSTIGVGGGISIRLSRRSVRRRALTPASAVTVRAH